MNFIVWTSHIYVNIMKSVASKCVDINKILPSEKTNEQKEEKKRNGKTIAVPNLYRIMQYDFEHEQ